MFGGMTCRLIRMIGAVQDTSMSQRANATNLSFIPPCSWRVQADMKGCAQASALISGIIAVLLFGSKCAYYKH
jgi:hypothetical protein